MRTTVELPDALLRRAKTIALQHGSTLKDIVIRALERELDTIEDHAPPKRLTFPLVKSARPGSLRLTNADIAQIELDDAAR
jgi:hypothetical protein